MINSNTPAVCLVGKSWDFHVDVALGITNDENLSNISESASHFIEQKKEFMFDAEHFFDGYKANKDYAISCLKAAYEKGARWIILCDTNGGTLPHEVSNIVAEVTKFIPGKNLGIHAHNDTGNAVSNSLAAVMAGVRQIQGTINALKDASIMFGDTPIVNQFLPFESVLSIETLVTASVPVFKILTL